MKLAFLCSEYPAISHTFVLREIAALRRLGLEIATFSLRRTPEEKLLSERDREAAATTFAILPPRWGRLLATHLWLALRAPHAYFGTLAHALSLAPPGPKPWMEKRLSLAVLTPSDVPGRARSGEFVTGGPRKLGPAAPEFCPCGATGPRRRL